MALVSVKLDILEISDPLCNLNNRCGFQAWVGPHRHLGLRHGGPGRRPQQVLEVLQPDPRHLQGSPHGQCCHRLQLWVSPEALLTRVHSGVLVLHRNIQSGIEETKYNKGVKNVKAL